MKTPTTLAGALRALHEARTPHFSDPGGPQLYTIIGTADDLGALTDAADQLDAQLAAMEAAPADDSTSAAAIAGMVRTALGEHAAEAAAADAALDEAIAKLVEPGLMTPGSGLYDAAGGSWVKLGPGERLQEPPTEAPPLPITAPDVLRRAEGHIGARAWTYDRPEGERSAGATAAAFNAITGRTGVAALTEPEAWLFLQCLKQVRLFQRQGYHADSAEDNVAYGALLAEAKAREAAPPFAGVEYSSEHRHGVTELGRKLREAVARQAKEGGAA